MNYSMKNFCNVLFNLIGTVGKVELISAFPTAVSECWNVSDNYTWDNAGDVKQLPTAVGIIGAIKRQFFHMVTHVILDSN